VQLWKRRRRLLANENDIHVVSNERTHVSEAHASGVSSVAHTQTAHSTGCVFVEREGIQPQQEDVWKKVGSGGDGVVLHGEGVPVGCRASEQEVIVEVEVLRLCRVIVVVEWDEERVDVVGKCVSSTGVGLCGGLVCVVGGGGGIVQGVAHIVQEAHILHNGLQSNAIGLGVFAHKREVVEIADKMQVQRHR